MIFHHRASIWSISLVEVYPLISTHFDLTLAVLGKKNKKTVRYVRFKSGLTVTGLCVEKSPVTGEFSAQMACNAENVSIWWGHHGICERNKDKFSSKRCMTPTIALPRLSIRISERKTSFQNLRTRVCWLISKLLWWATWHLASVYIQHSKICFWQISVLNRQYICIYTFIFCPEGLSFTTKIS